MGWSTSHDSVNRSADAMCEVGRHVANVLSAKDWRTVQKLFRLANRADGPFTISAREAGRMAAVLNKAAGHLLMPAAWRGEVVLLAEAAQCAATARQPWEWR